MNELNAQEIEPEEFDDFDGIPEEIPEEARPKIKLNEEERRLRKQIYAN